MACFILINTYCLKYEINVYFRLILPLLSSPPPQAVILVGSGLPRAVAMLSAGQECSRGSCGHSVISWVCLFQGTARAGRTSRR